MGWGTYSTKTYGLVEGGCLSITPVDWDVSTSCDSRSTNLRCGGTAYYPGWPLASVYLSPQYHMYRVVGPHAVPVPVLCRRL